MSPSLIALIGTAYLGFLLFVVGLCQASARREARIPSGRRVRSTAAPAHHRISNAL
jgi:hypothetical protein